MFSASAGMVLIFWGLTPSQAGIFATETTTRSFPATMLRSTGYLPLNEQRATLTALYAQSAYNIAWLNETLPPYMSRDFALAPLGPQSELATVENAEVWTGRTTLFSVNVTCEQVRRTRNSYRAPNGTSEDSYQSSSRCNYPASQLHPSNYGQDNKTEFEALHIGFDPNHLDPSADYGITYGLHVSQFCPSNSSRIFLIGWSRKRSLVNTTILFCEARYYQQEVSATIALPHKSVVGVQPLGFPYPLPEGMFNATQFEEGMNMEMEKFQNRGDFPFSTWPEHNVRVKDMSLSLSPLPGIAAYAIATSQRPAIEYLNSTLLQQSYQAAYRILFARRIVEILSPHLDSRTATLGERRYRTQSVVVVPTFAYIVKGMLSVLTLFAITLLYFSITRPRKLATNPGSLASIMSLVADSSMVLDKFKGLDGASLKSLEHELKGKRYRLMSKGKLHDGDELLPDHPRTPRRLASKVGLSHGAGIPVQPTELRLWFGVAFVSFQVTLAIALASLHITIQRSNGRHYYSRPRGVGLRVHIAKERK